MNDFVEDAGNGHAVGSDPLSAPVGSRGGGYVLITGGAGFVGANLADRLAASGRSVMVLDSLARPGVETNLAWLKERHGSKISAQISDIRDQNAVRDAVRGASEVFHLAAQVAVTTSIVDPVADFEVNARGTLNVLEAIRAKSTPTPLVFTSTNKVYGALPHLQMAEEETRYRPLDEDVCDNGVSEACPLMLYSPYGCSKGAADQYVLDYARTFGLQAVVLRMSCIYGPRQFGTEDQGWVAHFIKAALARNPITIYGDGKQVRDILFIDDLVRAFLLARQNIASLSGQAFNIGGGASNTVSLRELLSLIGSLNGEKPIVGFDDWRTGDQAYYVSDTRKFIEATGWKPQVSVSEGVARLVEWLRDWARVSTPDYTRQARQLEGVRP